MASSCQISTQRFLVSRFGVDIQGSDSHLRGGYDA